MFKDHLPEIDVGSLWEILADTTIPETDLQVSQAPLAIHDPWPTPRGEPAVQAAVRRLRSRVDAAIEELDMGR